MRTDFSGNINDAVESAGGIKQGLVLECLDKVLRVAHKLVSINAGCLYITVSVEQALNLVIALPMQKYQPF